MKKLLVLVALVAMVSTASFAQVQFGAKAGLNIAKGSGDLYEGTDSRMGLVIGAFAKFNVSEKLDFQPELLYSQQGSKETVDFEGLEIDGTAKLDYLNIPLMFKYNVANGLNIQAGPQVGFLMSAKYKMEFEGESETEDMKEFLKGIDFGLNFGLGYDFESGLAIDARYNLGMSNISDMDDVDGKNGVLQFTVGYAF
ncbi:PorT family protein [Labilibacter sediminis]|nr:PorT family protein [Labilibacter sediminis]